MPVSITNQEKKAAEIAPSTYSRLRRFTILLTSLVALAPLFIMTMVNYHLDQKAFRAETRYSISRILFSTRRTLEFLVKERQAALELIVNQLNNGQLADDEVLAATLHNLKKTVGGFVDLGLIDDEGVQINYVGPYDLKGRNYRDQGWFHEVFLRGVYTSDVFMGYRNFPHFIIAVKHESVGTKPFVLRATIDMELLNRQIYSLDLDRSSEVFIINHQGILQTSSTLYGDVLKKADFQIPAHSREREVIEEFWESGKWVTRGYTYINDTPFILIVIQKQDDPFGRWLSHRLALLWFLLGSIVLIFLAVFYSSSKLVNRVRDADQRRAKAFHHMEYTNKMATIGRLAAGVAHEINNPLAIINEKAGLMQDLVNFDTDYPNKDKTLQLINSVLKSVERCKNVTHRLLGFARRMDSRMELIDLENLLREVVGFIQTEAVHRNIEIVFEFPENTPAIESDRGQLQQVFLNLINNAFAAVDDGGKISLKIEDIPGNNVAVTICDNGTGIPPENLKHIFEPFFSTKGEFGTGLGLSITSDIIKKLGGRIDVQSEVGEGTCFKVTLPLKVINYME